MSDPIGAYDVTYGNLANPVQQMVLREAFGEYFGQESWLTADEYRRFLNWLELGPASNVLDVASGSGGPALFMARPIGCHVTGVDINEKGIATANEMAQAQGLASLVRFRQADASQPLPFEDQSFDAVICIDAINHLPNRSRVLAEWHRVLKSGGRLLFTDPITVTGLLSNEEIAIRSSIGYFLFAAPGEDERLLQEAGFELVLREDVTENVAIISKRRYEARVKYQDDLIKIEGEAVFEGLQRFFPVAHRIASERRLSRFVFVARKVSY